MSNEIIQFRNCRIIRGHALIKEDLWVRNGRIINPEVVFFDEKTFAHRRIDCLGAIIAPGFIDLQINGGFGVDFANNCDAVETGISVVAKGILAHGVTSFCPTVVTSSSDLYRKVLPKIKKSNGGLHGANILGLHLEGPFISLEKKGAHEPDYIRELTEGFTTLLETYGSLNDVSIITLAPEKAKALEVIDKLAECGITVALGHSMADLHHGELAIAHGSNLITHLFNAMLPFHHRDPGLVGLLSSDQVPAGKTVFFGIIADGVHTHPAALRIAYRTHQDGLILVTDAISAMGLEDGTHFIGTFSIDVRRGQAYIAGTNTLCGSVATMDECVRIFKKSTDCSIVYAVEAASLHPAQCLNITDRKGTLNFGADADFVMLDDNLHVQSTWIAGNRVYHI